MINGEGSREGASWVDYPDWPEHSQDSKSDRGEERHSSCEASELERYSSANSVMASPSVCSCSSVSNYSDCLGNSQFGSFRSVGFVDRGGLEGFGLGGRKGSGTSVDYGKEIKTSDGGDMARRVIKFDGGSGSKEEEIDGLSLNGRSEDEESMCGDRSEEEHKGDCTYSINTRHSPGSAEADFNPLLMTSPIAFGSNDWDDFTLETEENSGDGLMFDEFQRKRQSSYHNATDFPDDLCMPSEELQHEEMSYSFGVNHADPIASSARVGNSGMRDIPFGEKGNNQTLDVKDERENKDSPLGCSTRHLVIDESEEYLNGCSIMNVFEPAQDLVMEKANLEPGCQINSVNSTEGGQCSFGSIEQPIETKVSGDLEGKHLEVIVDQLSFENDVRSHNYPRVSEIVNAELGDDVVMSSNAVSLSAHHPCEVKDLAFSENLFKDQAFQDKTEALELNGYIDDVITEMEEILLDVGESPQLQKEQKLSQSRLGSAASRDAGSTASTSGNDSFVVVLNEKVLRIDRVEVIGARQKKGEVSLSERLVGVKEYTVYRIKVWGGDNNWEVERRYRDFLTLYQQMKALFSDEGWVLPPPWSLVDKESWKIFGSASPNVVAERSEIIQESLRSIIHSSFFSDLPPCFIWFLSHEDSHLNHSKICLSTCSSTGTYVDILSPSGKTIPLIVEVQPQKSLKHLLDAQQYRCAGCHGHFDNSKTFMRDFMQTLGWGKSRVCEYTGQVFCSVCHTNEATVLPAKVLHYWDFTEYPVCQLSKLYLDSIHDQPMLCIGAVNPFLFSRVPALQHVMTLRKKIGVMLPCIRCPFRGSVNRGLGSRQYLLECNDFFALRDLIDLSKGPFAALPVMLETVSKKIREHIMERCLICCDLGIPCGAKQACTDPSSLIFPFQENELEKCRYCQSVYHQKCFKHLGKCPCQSEMESSETSGSLKRNDKSLANEANGVQDLQLRKSVSIPSSGLFSALFSRSKSGKGDTVLLMGSLPSTSL